MGSLSPLTVSIIAQLFSDPERELVQEIVAEECGQNLPFMQAADERSLERVRFAVLKLSDGDPDRLLEAVALAQVDWRDVLVSAGFGYDVQAHLDWARAVFDHE